MLISQQLLVPWLRLRRKMKDIQLGSDQNVHRSRPSLEFSTDMQYLTTKSKIKVCCKNFSQLPRPACDEFITSVVSPTSLIPLLNVQQLPYSLCQKCVHELRMSSSLKIMVNSSIKDPEPIVFLLEKKKPSTLTITNWRLKSRPIGHFRVPPGLCFKTRVGAQPLIW